MVIDCGTFRLRPLRPDDAGSMASYANNYNVWRNLRDAFPHPYRLEDAVRFILTNIGVMPPTNLCIEYQGACVGVAGFFPQPDVYCKSADFGYWLGEPFWGQGIMTMAARRMVEYIFTHFDIVRIHAGIFEWNPASMRVLEKAGFRKEGVFEQAIYKDGQLTNEHRYSILKKDWHP
jgi:[ribosomal protein S5]-alanine N-acetyltransferase